MNAPPDSPVPPAGEPDIAAAHQLHMRALPIIAALNRAAFPAAWTALVSQLEKDFRKEEDLMEKIDFSNAHLHREQHTRVLSGLHHAAAQLLKGNALPARSALDDLALYLPLHYDTLDTTLVIASKAHGIAPITPQPAALAEAALCNPNLL